MKIEDLEDFILNILAGIVELGLSITFIVGIIKVCIWIWSV